MKKTVILLITAILFALLLTGCTGNTAKIMTQSEAVASLLSGLELDKADTLYTVVTPTEDGTLPCYDVELMVDGVVYRYRVDAAKGDILKVTVNDREVSLDKLPAFDESGYIGIDAAKAIALADAGITEDDLLKLSHKKDHALGVFLYDIEFITATHEYEYEINAETGEIFKKDMDGRTVKAPKGEADGEYIGGSAAEDVALTHAELTREGVIFETTKWKMKKGTAVYDIEFVSGSVEYEYTINATTGEVINAKTEGKATEEGSYIGVEAAKKIALAHAGLTEEEVFLESVEPDVKNGKTVYEVEFKSGIYEYEYKINAVSGDIVTFDKDMDD